MRRSASEALACYAVVAATLYGFRLVAGHDLNFDGRNYHLYTPYAFLNGLAFTDIAPARVQSYINPLGLLPFYWAATSLPPRAATAAIVVMQALNAIPVYLLCRLLAEPFLEHPWRIAAPLTFLGMTAAIVLSVAGTSFADLAVALPLSGALYLLVRAVADAGAPSARNTRRLVIGGLLLGAGVALKLSQAMFAASMGLALLVCSGFRPAFVVGLAGLVGWVVCGAWWEYAVAVELGRAFPLLYYIDTRFRPKDAMDVLLFPWSYALGSSTTAEVPLSDPRWLMALVLAGTGIAALGRRRQQPRLRANPAAFVILFVVVGYVVWRLESSVQRFAVNIDLAIPAVLVVTICETWRSAPARAAVAAGVVGLSLLGTRPGDWGSTAWRATWFPMQLPRLLDVPDAVILMTGRHDAHGFVVPSFPRGAHAHLVGDRTYVDVPRLAERLQRDIDRALPDVFAFGLERDRAAELQALRSLGVEATTECERGWIVAKIVPDITSLNEGVYTCRVRRALR